MALKGNKKSTQKKYTFFEHSQNNKKRKRLSVVMQYYVISIFVFISLLCTGFASWVTVGFTVGGSASGSSFGAYQSINTEDYVKYNSLQCFDYCEIGFVSNNALADTATVTVTYTYNGKTISDKYGTQYSLQLTFYGTQADGTTTITLFNTNYLTAYSVKIGSSEVTATPETRNDNSLVLNVAGGDLASYIGADGQTLTVTYTFTCASNNFSNFYNQIKPDDNDKNKKSTFNAYVKLLAN